MPNMLVASVARRLRQQARRWDAERAKIQTTADVRARNQFVLAEFREMMGPLPPKPALAAQTTRTIDRPGYRIENILFQSRPDYWIPANLYVHWRRSLSRRLCSNADTLIRCECRPITSNSTTT